MKMCVAINKCNSCMKSQPKVVVVSTDIWGNVILKILCQKCYTIKKLEGTLYG